jgi:hypothetical protein
MFLSSYETLSYCCKRCQHLALTKIDVVSGAIMLVPNARTQGRLSGAPPCGFLSFSIHRLQYLRMATRYFIREA